MTPVRVAVSVRWERSHPGGSERRAGYQLTFNERIVEVATLEQGDGELKRIARLFNYWQDAMQEAESCSPS